MLSEKTIKKMKLSHIGKIHSGSFKKGFDSRRRPGVGETHYRWKGENAGYSSKHKWIVRKYGRASKCQNKDCIYPRKNKKGTILNSPKKITWANLSETYKRDISNYIQLCVSCHSKFDLGLIEINGIKKLEK